MRTNRTVTTIGLVGLAGGLVTGIGMAQAASGDTTTTTVTSSATAPGFGGWGRHGGGFGGGYGATDDATTGECLDAAAEYLGMSEDDLRAQLTDGKSLAQLAEEQGTSVDGLKQAMLAAAENHLDEITGLTDEQKADRLEQLSSWFDTLIDEGWAACPGRGLGAADDATGGTGSFRGGRMHGARW